jgi:alpha-D-ribose 1-methylphosphonate 5-triphosphate synthase subunit PhnL
MANILTVENLSKTFHMHNFHKEIKVIEKISFTVKEGQFIGITGKSGSGKSTILKCIYRTYLPQVGDIWYKSENDGIVNLRTLSEREMLHLRKNEIGYVSQFLTSLPRITPWDYVRQAVLERGFDEQYASQETEKILTHFELSKELWDNYASTLSGGEKLRVNIARAMVKKPRLLLLDEPTASLDQQSKERVKELIEQLVKEGTTMLGIFHDLEFMKNLCDVEYRMENGKLAQV